MINHQIEEKTYREVVYSQYEKKFGRFGAAVVESNMKVMDGGFTRVKEINYGDINEEDTSSMRNPLVSPQSPESVEMPMTAGCEESNCKVCPMPEAQARSPFQTIEKFNSEFRKGFGYHQPAGAFASLSVMAAASGATQSKYVARRETPVFIAENCTQCMECITACPDTAMPNSAQDIKTILSTAIKNYVSKKSMVEVLLKEIPRLEGSCQKVMNYNIANKIKLPFKNILEDELKKLNFIDNDSGNELIEIINKLPLAYNNVNAIYRTIEKKEPGSGGFFSIFISDLCKGCGECVQVCGEHNALNMTKETPALNAELSTEIGRASCRERV